MEKCDRCGKEIKSLPFNCKFCGKTFCGDHHLPENHGCVKLYKLKERNIKRLAEGKEALDFRAAKKLEPTKSELFERELERERKGLKKEKGFWKRFFGI